MPTETKPLPQPVGVRAESPGQAHQSLRMDLISTLPGLLDARVRLTPDLQAYSEFVPQVGWTRLTWHQFWSRVQRWKAALAGLQLAKGSRIAILLANGFDAACLDQAALALALVPVPLHDLDNPESIAFILEDSGASFLMVSSGSQWDAICGAGRSLPALGRVVVRSGPWQAVRAPDGGVAASVQWLDEWLDAAQASLSPAVSLTDPPDAREPLADDLAALVYTSGTTGKPKGVMLTHRNVIANVRSILERIEARADDVFLSFLPLSHTFERTAGYYLPLAAGSCVVYARSVALLAEDLQSVRPTILISVPRIYERFHTLLQGGLASSPWRKGLFDFATNVGWRRFCRKHHLPPGPGEAAHRSVLDDLAWPWLQQLVARQVLRRFGGRLRMAVTGGAPLSPAVARCFLGLGLPLLQGYGMTESSPVISVNTVEDNDPGTVGRPLPGVEVRLGEAGELQVRGPNIMRGYWHRPDDTTRVLSPDGWLSSGDLARLDDGRIRIVGRLKEIIVTSTGEKVPPADVEMAITADPLFAQAFVVGDDRPFIGCVVVLDPARWQQWAAGLQVSPDAGSLDNPMVRQQALQRVQAATSSFPRPAMPRAVYLSLEPWTLQNSLMTPTLKLKRKNLQGHFAAAIEAMYGPSVPAQSPGAKPA